MTVKRVNVATLIKTIRNGKIRPNGNRFTEDDFNTSIPCRDGSSVPFRLIVNSTCKNSEIRVDDK